MEDGPLQYDVWIEDALRSVIRTALGHVAHEGLPGEHHFYITFRVDDPGAVVPPVLRERHPEEMTIVLQHQFDNLHVDQDAFEVTLYFGGKAERLRVPFRTVVAFSDPSVNFGLQLKVVQADDEEAMAEFEDGAEAPPSSGVNEDNAAAAPSANGDSDGDDGNVKTGEVIALDAFRKK